MLCIGVFTALFFGHRAYISATFHHFFPEVVTDKMTLSDFAHFEILNELGEVILEGKGKVISLRLLKAGDYFIVLEDQEYPFVKK